MLRTQDCVAWRLTAFDQNVRIIRYRRRLLFTSYMSGFSRVRRLSGATEHIFLP